MLQQQRIARNTDARRCKAASWLSLLTVTCSLLAFTSGALHSSLITAATSSAADYLSSLLLSQAYFSQDANSIANMAATAIPQDPADVQLASNNESVVESLDSKAQMHFPSVAADTHNPWLSSTSSHYQPDHASRHVHTDWAAEESLLRVAELESDLACMHEEQQQLSAHLLHAVGQLAAVGQPQLSPAVPHNRTTRGALHSSTGKRTLFWLALTCTICWTLWRAAEARSAIRQQEAGQGHAVEQVLFGTCHISLLLSL